MPGPSTDRPETPAPPADRTDPSEPVEVDEVVGHEIVPPGPFCPER